MTCLYCRHPLPLPAIVGIKEVTEQLIGCPYCGAKYKVVTHILAAPEMSMTQLERIKNVAGSDKAAIPPAKPFLQG